MPGGLRDVRVRLLLEGALAGPARAPPPTEEITWVARLGWGEGEVRVRVSLG